MEKNAKNVFFLSKNHNYKINIINNSFEKKTNIEYYNY